MREPGEIVAAFPRPGRTLKAVLAVIAAFALAGAVIVNWAPGGERGVELFRWLAFEPARPLARPWTILSSGLLTSPEGISHALWSLLGLYFLTPDLEKRWGGARLVRFLATAVVLGNLMVLAGSYVLPDRSVFHPGLTFGPMAAITAAVIAWSKENAQRQIRFMFFLPMSGKTLYWLTIGFAFISLVFLQGAHEGGLAPIGGILTGILFAGSPSPVRALWLRLRLGSLQKRRGGITVEELLGDEPPSRPRPKRGGKAPPLRVVQGGLEEDLKNRKPPKDKRYLN
ncbi:MAG: rhomboid family intramembrane serine protease [Labilithrix sp.]|nr:rhomboid family intramembrane serine protease [Labilithrix sp.]MBX3223686.1 rhomboid family intramembrane serine protease [Labilithrix sp.]